MRRALLVAGGAVLAVAAVAIGLLVFRGVDAPEPAAFDDVAVAMAGDARVAAFFDPDPPRERGNTAWLYVTRGGRPVEGAEVGVEAMMPEMGAMPEMREKADVTGVGGGIYRAAFDLPMGGGWSLEVEVGRTKAAFQFTVGSEGLIGDGEAAAAAPVDDGAVRIDASRRQEFGIRTSPVTTGPLTLRIRAPGEVVFDETAVHDVALTTGGYVRELLVDETGQRVRRGQALFAVYDPGLYAAQKEWLLVRGRASADPLRQATRERLRLLGLTDAQIEAIAESGEAREAVPIGSPVDGYVVEKRVVEGQRFEEGETLYRVAPLDPLWVEAEIYAKDVPYVRAGQPATVTFPALPGLAATGPIELAQPTIGRRAQTRTIRVAVANPGEAVLPGLFADVAIEVERGDAVLVPESAVLYAGDRRIAFVDAGDGRLVPREIEVGARSDGRVEVRAGLSPGEEVVTSGTFLVAAESRLRAATDLWEADDAR